MFPWFYLHRNVSKCEATPRHALSLQQLILLTPNHFCVRSSSNCWSCCQSRGHTA